MKTLVLCADVHHPASVVREGLAPLAGDERTFDFVEDADGWSAEAMADYPVVLFTRANHRSADDKTPWMTPEVETAFVDYVRNGGGLFVVHSGTAGYDSTPEIRRLFGGVFDHHPKQCPVEVAPENGSPLVEGVDPFTLVDEHYFMEFDDGSADVYLTARSEHGEQPAGWTRTDGNGGVCVLTPGHNVEVWLHPSFQALLANGLAWCDAS